MHKINIFLDKYNHYGNNQNFVDMNRFLIVTVECPDRSDPGKFKTLYKNTISFDESIKIPFEILIEAFRVLYPQADNRVMFNVEL